MRLIDGDELINKLTETQGDVFHHGVSEGLRYAITVIAKMKTIDTVKHGRWEDDGYSGSTCCSCCGMEAFYRDNRSWFDDHEYEDGDDGSGYVLSDFCPWCGADLRE